MFDVNIYDISEFPRRSPLKELLQICSSINGKGHISNDQLITPITCSNVLSLGMQDDFSNTDYSVHGPKAFFANMPLSKTLTMNIDVPEPWLVEPVVAM